MSSDEKRDKALTMLREKYSELDRLPVRSDFSPEDICFIKQKLGPFPRALEQAGLKPVTKPSAAQRSREKRRRTAERRKIQRLKPDGKRPSENSETEEYE